LIEIKKVVLGLLILYVAVFSGLFIKQAYKFNKQMNQKINFETKEYYEEFIKESRAKVQQYRTLSTTNEHLSCLNEVEKMIDISYKNQHPKAKTYIELMYEYYDYYQRDKTSDEYEYNYSKVYNVCKFKEKNIYNNTNITKRLFPHIANNLAIIDEEFFNSMKLYNIDITFDDHIMNKIATPSYDNIRERTNQTTRDYVIKNEIELIELVLEMIGEDYE